MSNARQIILADLITKAKQAYYFSGSPIMSDAEYDALESELADLCPQHALLQNVGAPLPEAAQHLSKVKHSMPMGSQAKVNTPEEFAAWCSRRPTSSGLHCSLKADGCSIAAYYRKGKLVQAISRGDGETGEDVTANALSFKGLPSILSEPLNCSVRLEAVLTVQDWLKLDPARASNPRSLANGILGRKDGKNSHLLSTLAFDLEGIELQTEREKSLWLEQHGFTPTTWQLAQNLPQVKSFVQQAQQARNLETWDYWSDGVVVKLNSLSDQRELGTTSGRPKGQIAWKFSAEHTVATLLQVEWSVGHTGAITPIANITPVRLGGTTVQRISLANPDMIAALGLRNGSQVEVVKAGDIIPKITKVVKAGRGAPVEIPSKCPSCLSALKNIRNTDGSQSTVLYCRNPECEAQGYGRIRRWAKSRDILGLGDSVIQALCNSGQVQIVADLFSLAPDKIQNLLINPEKKIRLGFKRATNICQEIKEKGTRMSLPEFLGSFGTHKLGVRRASLMVAANPALTSLEKWFDGSLEDKGFSSQAGVPNMGVQIFAGLQERAAEIRSSLKFVEILQPQSSPKSKRPTICITGSLPSGKKKHDWEQVLDRAGYTLEDSVNKDLYALVVSNPSQTSSKTKKALKLGIRLMTEAELEKLCQTKP